GYTMRGSMLSSLGQAEPAEAAYLAAIHIMKALTDRHPQSTEYQIKSASLHHQAGFLMRQQGRLAEARRFHEVALKAYQQLVAEFPNVPDLQGEMAEATYHFGLVLTALGERRAAEEAFRQAADSLERLVQAFPGRLEHWLRLAKCWNDFGNLYAKTDRPREA